MFQQVKNIQMKFVTSLLIGFTTLIILANCNSKKEVSAYTFSDKLKTPEEELAGFTLLDGFTIELVASERDGIVNPIDLTFDDNGKLWTQTARMYPLDPIADAQWNDLLRLMDDPEAQKNHPAFKRVLDLYQGKTKGIDKILVLSNLYDNKPISVNTWADSLTIPMSILPYKDGAYVAQGSELFFLRDSNRDGRAEQRIPMFTGFGFVDTHTMAHLLVRGPGGWVYFSHGALNKGEVKSPVSDAKQRINYSKIARFSMDAKKLELVSAGLNNIWGFQLRSNGQWYCTEANDLGYSVVPVEPGTAFKGIGNERIRNYQPWMPELHKFRVGGTGISGLAFADDKSGSFPSEWKDVAFLANPITSTINAVKIERNDDGSVTAKHLPDLLTSKDKYFRPVNIEFGPDGCLYVADWYDKIISHNEISRNDPDRDKTHGRIWRIRHVSQKPYKIPDFNTVKTEDLVDYLKSPSLWMKRSAWHQIADRSPDETQKLVPRLIELARDTSQDEHSRIHALWSLEGMKHYDSSLISSLLEPAYPNICREAIRSLASFSLERSKIAIDLSKLIDHSNPMIRSQVLRTLSEVGKADSSIIAILVRACKPELPGSEMGGSYERKFERYLALKAIEQYPDELVKFLNSFASSRVPVSNLIWAIQALPKQLEEKYFLALWSTADIKDLDESTFIQISKMLENKKVYSTVKVIFQDPTHAAKYLDFALRNQQEVQSPTLSALLESPANVLLKSDSLTDKKIALEAISRLKINAPYNDICALINDETPSAIVKLAMLALEPDMKQNKLQFERIFNNKKYDFEVRIAALNSISGIDKDLALTTIENWLPGMNAEEKKILVNNFCGSVYGSDILLNLYQRKLLVLDNFSHGAAERIYNANLGDKVAKSLVTEARNRADLERREFNSKKNRYLTLIEKAGGDATKGKVIFEATCLQCHKVGQKGQDIAPALDGSSARANEALITSILNPDAAVEGGYAMYRLVKKDNSITEGYLYSKDDRGVTIAFMGGNKTFFETNSIKEQGFINGRSFMPKGLLEAYNEQQAADLFAYIRSLK